MGIKNIKNPRIALQIPLCPRPGPGVETPVLESLGGPQIQLEICCRFNSLKILGHYHGVAELWVLGLVNLWEGVWGVRGGGFRGSPFGGRWPLCYIVQVQCITLDCPICSSSSDRVTTRIHIQSIPPVCIYTGSIWGPYRAYTVHIQASRWRAVYIPCVYSPYMCIHTRIQCAEPIYSHMQSIYSPYAVRAHYGIHPMQGSKGPCRSLAPYSLYLVRI